jgi:hypothetical protein
MSAAAIDDHISRYIRRIQLGLRFLGHGARAHTTCAWTGLTPDQLVTVRRRSRFNSNNRRRGPSPSSYSIFFRSNRSSSQAALFISICRVVGLMRPTISIENGERLCEAYEIYREWEPASDLEFEQAVLLLEGTVHGASVEFRPCASCAGSLLIDKFGDTQNSCHLCRRNQRETKGSPRESRAYSS